MAVRTGKDLRFYLDGYDLGLSTTKVDMVMASTVLDATKYGDAAEVVVGGLRVDDQISWVGWFDDVAQGVDPFLGTGIGATAVVSFVLGTATGTAVGGRVYCGSALSVSAAPGGNVGELARVVASIKPVGTLLPCIHYGLKQSRGSGGNSGTIDHGAGTTGTTVFFTHFFAGGTATGTLTLRHSADGTTFAVKGTVNYTGTGSQRTEFTGSLNRYTDTQWDPVVGLSSGTFFAAIRRP